MRSGKQGLALLVVIGILGVLAVFGTAFATLAHMERRASQQRVQTTRALLLARSGIEDALARITMGQDPSFRSSRYSGEDADLDGALGVQERPEEVFRPARLDVEDCPLRHALRPGFSALSGVLPRAIRAGGRRRGYSGMFSSGSAPALSYALKIEDESAKININGGLLDGEDRDSDGIRDHRDSQVRPLTATSNEGWGWNAQLTRILNILGSQPEVGVPALGTDLLLNRPPGGYRSVEEAMGLIATGIDLSPWLTVSSWVDRSVIRPNAFSPESNWSDPSRVKKERGSPRLEEGGRPPVNLNAASGPVLVALLQGLSAGNDWTYSLDKPAAVRTNRSDYTVSPPVAAVVAAAISSARPFQEWGDFDACIRALEPAAFDSLLPWQVSPASTMGVGDLIRANFDPNSMLHSLAPDQIRWRWVDKSDLLAHSTEGNLGPTGTFRITSLARVHAPSGALTAEASVSLLVEAFALTRQSTQRDFVGSRPLTDHLSRATAQRTTGASASWNTWASGQGLGAMTYPCAPMASAAEYDGCVGLATVEEAPLAAPAPSTGMGQLRFLHHFDDGWDADVSAVPGLLRDPQGATSELQTDPGIGVWPEATQEPGSLYPDGAFVHRYHGPAYRVAGNLPEDLTQGDHGVLSFWAKCFRVPVQNAGVHLDFLCVRYSGPATQALCLGYGGDYGIQVENWAVLGNRLDPGHEIGERRAHYRYSPDARWYLVTALYDTDETTYRRESSIEVLGAIPPRPPIPYGPASFSGLAIEKMTLDPDLTFCLGGELMGENGTVLPCSVLDEFAIYDFGDDFSPAKADCDAWGLTRFRGGRYYKGGDGAFLSTPMAPDAHRPVRLLRAFWTERSPVQQRLVSNGYWSDGLPRPIDPTLTDAAGGCRLSIALDLLDPAATLATPVRSVLRQGGRIDQKWGSFCYRARFLTDLASPTDPVLETPFLDDVTFAWQAASGPRILAWRR